ncbi:MAG: hypothetical protein ACYS0F_15740, partial [Planctomycetota bacterium]
DYAFTDIGSLTGGGDVTSVSHATLVAPRFYAGWRFGESGTTQLGMTFWEYDDSATGSTGTDPSNIGPLLASPAFLVFSQVDSADAESRLRATLVDGGARWRHGLGERGSFRFDVELRFFRYERQSQVFYSRDSGQLRELFINSTSDARGVGPRLAASYRHQFGRVGVGGQFGVAVPVGDLESEERQELLIDGSFNSAVQASEAGTRRAFLQIEGEIGVDVRLAGGWAVTFSYAFQQWSGIERRHRFIDVAAQSTTVVVERDAVFEGFLFGIRYGF